MRLTEKVAQSSAHLVEWWPVDDPSSLFGVVGGSGVPHGVAHGQHGVTAQRYARRQDPGGAFNAGKVLAGATT